MGGVVERYFENIFTTLNPLGFEDIINGIHHRVFDGSEVDMGGGAFQAFEVHQVFKQMAPLMMLRPDSMSPIFFKSFWYIIGEDVKIGRAHV